MRRRLALAIIAIALAAVPACGGEESAVDRANDAAREGQDAYQLEQRIAAKQRRECRKPENRKVCRDLAKGLQP